MYLSPPFCLKTQPLSQTTESPYRLNWTIAGTVCEQLVDQSATNDAFSHRPFFPVRPSCDSQINLQTMSTRRKSRRNSKTHNVKSIGHSHISAFSVILQKHAANSQDNMHPENMAMTLCTHSLQNKTNIQRLTLDTHTSHQLFC